MRRERDTQLPIFGFGPDHRLAEELKTASEILDDNPSFLNLVLHDLCDTARSSQGAPDPSAEQVLRSAIFKHRERQSYPQLAFLSNDSQCYRRFPRLSFH